MYTVKFVILKNEISSLKTFPLTRLTHPNKVSRSNATLHPYTHRYTRNLRNHSSIHILSLSLSLTRSNTRVIHLFPRSRIQNRVTAHFALSRISMAKTLSNSKVTNARTFAPRDTREVRKNKDEKGERGQTTRLLIGSRARSCR